LPDKQLIALRN